jgi:hypothetical protein
MYDFGMIKVPTNFYASPASGPAPTLAGPAPERDPTPADDVTPDSERNRKPRTRLSKWLAKIAGVYDGEMEPKTEAEYYLNEIAAKGGGSSGGGANVLTLYFDEPAGLEKCYAFKDSALTERYTSYEEARDALRLADIIKLKNPNTADYQESLWAYRVRYEYTDDETYDALVSVVVRGHDQMLSRDIYLVHKEGK